MSFHRDEHSGSIHQINNWTFANETDRLAYVPAESDLDKVAKQLDNNSFWVLLTVAPTWIQITSSTPPDGDPIKRVTTASATVEAVDRFIKVLYTATGPCNIILTDGLFALSGIEVVIFDAAKNAGKHNILITTQSGQPISGDTEGVTIMVNDGCARILIDNGEASLTGGIG